MANAPKVTPADTAAANAVIGEAAKMSPSATPQAGEGTNAPAMAEGAVTSTPQAGNPSNVTSDAAAQAPTAPVSSFEQDLAQFSKGFSEYFNKLEASQKHMVRQAFMDIVGGEGEVSTVAPTREVMKSKNKDGTTLTEEQQHEAYLKKYGPGYVVAQRPTSNEAGAKTQQTVFSANSWKRLPAKRDGSRDGWRQVIATPPEVKRLSSTKKRG